ncbi:MAG: DUF2075 domain-containing protein [Microlunatus sp.]|nr:DUF2075 domain-containing protein [Microlunatus sp.]
MLATDLAEAGLSDVEALIEYQLPLSSKRVDVVLCGRHPRTGHPQYVLVELKQWSSAHLLEDSDTVCVLDGLGERLHPVEQVRRYCSYLSDFAATVNSSDAGLTGVAYLHNATDGDVASLWQLEPSEQGRMFTRQRRGAFLSYLKQRLAPESGAIEADLLLSSVIRPSKQLLSLAAEEVQRREQFVLIDEQEVAYELVMRAVERSMRANLKEAIIVSGGPGSGKSVIALSLVGELSRQGRSVLHATGSSAFTNTLRRVAGQRAPRVREMFRFFNQFGDAEANSLDVLICDEAHRIRATSVNRYTPAQLRTGRPQVEELIAAARVPVFLLDEHQVVRPGEIGTIADIRAAAQEMGIGVRVVDLDGQFRCGGSRLYEDWVLRLLELEPGGPVPWEGDENFTLSVAQGPSIMETRLREVLSRGYGARMAAGYCWPWSNAKSGRQLELDVRIDDWHRPWNNKKETSHEGAPGRSFWASDGSGFGQVGCVYTAQGFEYDYAGVIFGPDLVWRGDRWIARPDRSHDTQVKRSSAADFARAVKNTYKVLLTRGMRGVLIYSTDPETQAMLHQLVPGSSGER